MNPVTFITINPENKLIMFERADCVIRHYPNPTPSSLLRLNYLASRYKITCWIGPSLTLIFILADQPNS